MCCPTLLSDFRNSYGPNYSPRIGKLGGGRPLCITDYRSVIPYMVGQTNEKYVSRFTRMHQAAHAEPHRLYYKLTERTRGFVSSCYYEVLVYTSLRHSCPSLFVILELLLRMEDINRELFISNNKDTEGILSKPGFGLLNSFFSSHLFWSIPQIFVLNGRLLSPNCPLSTAVLIAR